MTRLFVDPARLPPQGGPLVLTGTDHHYLVHVLRRRAGDPIVLLDGEGRQAAAVLADTAGGTATLQVAPPRDAAPHDEGPRITLIQGLLKGDKLDLIMQKATELGACRIVPVLCARSVARPDPARAAQRHGRWERILRGAAQQCRRPSLPTLDPIADLRDVLAGRSGPWPGLRLLPFEGALRRPLQAALPAPLPADIAVLIGPEGGFAPDEVAAAERAGFVPCGLGPRILRAETAALAVLAVLAYVADGEQARAQAPPDIP